MLPGLLANIHRLLDFCTGLLRESDSTFVFKGPWFAGMDYVVTCDPANANHIFNTHHNNYPNGDYRLEVTYDIFGNGLISCDGDLWKHQRRIGHAHMNNLHFRFSVARWSREKVENSLMPLLFWVAENSVRVTNLQDVFKRFAFDVTCKLILGLDPGSLSPDFPTVPFSNARHDVEEGMFLRGAVPKFWWKLKRKLQIGTEKRITMACKSIDQFIVKCIAERREAKQRNMSYQEQDETPSDLLASILDREMDDLSHLESNVADYFRSDKFLRDNTLTFLAAGNETTGTALSWFFHLLLKNADVEKKILKELCEIHPIIGEGKCSQRKVFDDNNSPR